MHSQTTSMVNPQSQEFLCFDLAGQTYCTSILQVREVRLPMTCTPLSHPDSAVLGVINLRGEIVPLIDLHARLGHPAARRSTDSQLSSSVMLILEIESRLVAVQVDQVHDVIHVRTDVIQTLPPSLGHSTSGLVIGMLRVEDRLLLNLDLAQLMVKLHQDTVESIPTNDVSWHAFEA
jgi:purine-binding chemotaxis protein CheW